MSNPFNDLTKDLAQNPGAQPAQIVEVEDQLGVKFPEEYSKWMTETNGAEGLVGQHSYLMLWPSEKIVPLNKVYEVNEFAPGLILFGSNGSDTGYAFDSRVKKMPIVEVPFIGMSLNEAKMVGDTFYDFLQYLREQGT